MKGTKEFYELMDQFERDLNKMPVYVGAKVIREKDSKHSFYTNDTINKMFIGYMAGYQFAKCRSRLGDFD